MSEKSYRNALPTKYKLHWYQINKVLGQGAFGITYLADDINLDRPVAIKEYIPGQLSVRESDQSVSPISKEQQDDFKWGLSRFISEAQTLTKFEHPNLVRVFNVFEANNTAYMVMNYEIGESLHQILKRKKSLGEDELTSIMLPLMSGLEKMHEKGFIHRDIKPGNIFIRNDGSPVLLDFGSARQTRGRDNPQTLTNFVSPGYAPIEQYASKSDRQGPWTDIYGMGATLYKAITGILPVAAVDRSETIVHDMKDEFEEVSKLAKGMYSEKFLAAIDHALAFKAQDRPQTIADWRNEFDFNKENMPAMEIPETPVEKTANVIKDKAGKNPDEVDAEGPTVDVNAHAGAQELPAEQISSSDTLVQKKSKHKLYVVSAVVVSVIISGFIIFWTDETNDAQVIDDQVIDDQVNEVQVHDNELPVVQQPTEEIVQDETEMEIIADNEMEVETLSNDQERIQELLTLASNDINEMRLTTPKENNAYERYQEILTLEANNEAAMSGIQAISDKYIRLAYADMESEKFDRARYYINKAEAVWDDSEKIAQARETLKVKTQEKLDREKAQEQQQEDQAAIAKSGEQEMADKSKESEEAKEEESDSMVGGIKKWFKEHEDASTEQVGDDFRKKIGGGN